jgi:hypothetical protein
LMSTWAYNNLIKHVYSRLLFIGSVLIICYFIFILFLSIVFFVFLIPFLINWCELIVLSLALWLI